MYLFDSETYLSTAYECEQHENFLTVSNVYNVFLGLHVLRRVEEQEKLTLTRAGCNP